jgi:hypothetical protein
MALTLRSVKGSALTYAEGDGNFNYLLTNMSGSNISITGSTSISGSLNLPSTTNIGQSNVLTINPSTGQIYYQTSASLNVTSASYASYASNALSASYATTASYAITASYAVTSSYAISASYSLSASYAVSASRAVSASYSATSSYSTTASYAVSASYATTSSYTLNTGPLSFDRQTANYTLVLSDYGKVVEMNSGSANLLTVPSSSTVNFPIGTEIAVIQRGTGVTTFTTASIGVTINSYSGSLTMKGQYAAAALLKVNTDEWYLIGRLLVNN